MKPFLIGLTGGIASGKNAVADMLAARGAAIVDADLVSRDLMQPGSPMLAQIASVWSDVLEPNGALDRPALAARVFGREEEVRKLNAITHPAILAEMERRAMASGADVAVMMAPLLFESGADAMVDQIWVVTADEDERVRRILSRDALSETQARARIAAQLPVAESVRRAHVVIENNGDLRGTESQVEAAWRALQERNV